MSSFFHSLGRNLIDSLSPGGIRGQQHQRFEEGLQQQQADILKQQELDRQRQADFEFHQALSRAGARPVINGVVQDQSTLPDALGLPGHPMIPNNPITIHRPADSSRVIKFKDHAGQPVAYELPTAMEQAKLQADLGGPQRAADVQQTQAMSAARTAGEGAALTQVKQGDREARGVPLTQDDVDRYQMPASMVGFKVLPEEATQLSRGIVPASIRAESANFRTKYASDLRAQTQKAIADQKQAFDERRLGFQNQWAQARLKMQQANEAGRNARATQRIGIDEKLHGQYVDQAFAEEQKQLQAQALLSQQQERGWFGGTENVQAVPDGQEFTDPWSGKKMIMNYAQRLRLQNALESSQRRAQSLHERADEIANRYGLGEAAPAPGGGAPAASPAPTPAATPAKPPAGGAAQPAAPAASAAAPKAKPGSKGVITKAQVAVAAKRYNMTMDTAIKRYTDIGYVVK